MLAQAILPRRCVSTTPSNVRRNAGLAKLAAHVADGIRLLRRSADPSCRAPALAETMTPWDSLRCWRPMSCVRSCWCEVWGYG